MSRPELPELPELPRAYARVLVVTAHPDDAEFAFGATIARLTGLGSDVRYLICSDGSLGGADPDVSAADLAARRESEQRDAAAVLGVQQVQFLGLPDGELEPSRALRLAIAREIRRQRPDLVLTHQPLRSLVFPIGASHPDHLAVGEATLRAVYPDAGNPRALPELLAQGLAAHNVAEVWVPGHEHANLFVALNRDQADRKVEAILRHVSQFETSTSPRDDVDWVVQRLRGYGPSAGATWAEAFCRIVCGTFAAVATPVLP